MNGIVSMITPLLLHMVISDVCRVFLGQALDSTSCTSAASLIVIPIALWMYLSDRKGGEAESMTNKTVQDSRKSAVQSKKSGSDRKNVVQSKKSGSGRKKLLFGIFCIILGGVLNLAVSGIMNLWHITQSFSNETQEALLAAQILIQLIGLGILVPLAEELVFRGLIYTRMKRFFQVKLSIFFSALLFAVYHGNPIQIIFAFPMALALAIVYEQGGSLVFPILFHAGSNLTAILVNFL